MKMFLKKTKAMLPGNVSMHSGANYLNLAFWLCGFTWGVVSVEFPVSRLGLHGRRMAVLEVPRGNELSVSL